MEIPSIISTELPEGATLIDVREQNEWDAGHAPGAVHLPVSELQERTGELPDEEFYVICRVGGRSFQVTQWLQMTGFDAVNVADGMDGWLTAGKPVVTDDGSAGTVI
jgi:rhodanese-related sulfurtransferase